MSDSVSSNETTSRVDTENYSLESSTPKNSTTPEKKEWNHLETMAKLTEAHQAQAMEALMLDRCLLRRDMRLNQNKTYDLETDAESGCEEDMGVQVGDSQTDNSKVVNNYYSENPTIPCPPKRWPWWLVGLLVVPWVVLTTVLVVWLILNFGGGNSGQPILWRLDIDSENPGLVIPQE